ncbi:sigma factor-like helix-turn-helix DNA-binding protein [Micromonospora sp. NPDC002389]|uniref:RNA polymerase sigma factor n=1 Tax=Micromonospora sp. NPDC002389 TaxID=3154272 RepID=UPI0033258B37
MEADEFETFVRRSTPALRRYARAVAADPDQAEDLLQETYVRVAGVWHRVFADGNPFEYAKITMIRLHIGRLRTLVRRIRLTPAASPLAADGGTGSSTEVGLGRVTGHGSDRVDDGWSGDGVEDGWSGDGVEDGDLLRRLLAGLPPAQRAVLVMAYLDDLDDAAIAEAIGRRPATVRSLRHRALDAIRPGLSSVRAEAGRKVAG